MIIYVSSSPVLWLWWRQEGCLLHHCTSEADIRAWQAIVLHCKISECRIEVILSQKPRSPSSFSCSKFIYSVNPACVKCISVHFIWVSCLFHKLWSLKGSDTTYYLGSFPGPWRDAFSWMGGASGTGLADCWTNEYFKHKVIFFLLWK